MKRNTFRAMALAVTMTPLAWLSAWTHLCCRRSHAVGPEPPRTGCLFIGTVEQSARP
jgi:hypothetical protein